MKTWLVTVRAGDQPGDQLCFARLVDAESSTVALEQTDADRQKLYGTAILTWTTAAEEVRAMAPESVPSEDEPVVAH